jgi:hypothetical protein
MRSFVELLRRRLVRSQARESDALPHLRLGEVTYFFAPLEEDDETFKPRWRIGPWIRSRDSDAPHT